MADPKELYLAQHYGERAAQALIDAVKLCDSPEQQREVALRCLCEFAATACGAIAIASGIPAERIDAPAILEFVAAQMRTARAASGAIVWGEGGADG